MTFELDDLHRSIDSTTAPAYITDRDGRIKGWNSAAHALLGHTVAEVRGRRCDQVVDGRDVFGNAICGPGCPVRQVSRQRALQRFRMHVRTAADYYVEVECTYLRVRNDEGDEAIIHLLQPVPDGHHRPAPPGEGATDTVGPSNSTPLTPRETEVLRLLAAGLGTRAVAEELSVSVATVRTHVENILQKLEVHSRLEAVALALRKGLL
jgi:DNA-binding CsgD family transcriptional regulator